MPIAYDDYNTFNGDEDNNNLFEVKLNGFEDRKLSQ
jgi:hypothetical protein